MSHDPTVHLHPLSFPAAPATPRSAPTRPQLRLDLPAAHARPSRAGLAERLAEDALAGLVVLMPLAVLVSAVAFTHGSTAPTPASAPLALGESAPEEMTLVRAEPIPMEEMQLAAIEIVAEPVVVSPRTPLPAASAPAEVVIDLAPDFVDTAPTAPAPKPASSFTDYDAAMRAAWRARRTAPARAKALWQRARALEPHRVEPTANLALHALRRGQPTVARPLFEQCLDRSPFFGPCRYGLGAAMIRTGDAAEGRAHLERYVEMQPNGSYARKAEALLR